MGMFLNYDAIADNYSPNNLKCSFPVGKSYTKLDPIKASKPYEEYNAKGELVGYFWYQGETVNLEFNIDGEITVESDAIILSVAGQTPSENEGKLYQRAYNIQDQKSWTCTSIVNDVFVWTQDAEFTYDITATKPVYISADSFLKNKVIEFVIYNFRKEPIYSKTFEGSSKIIVHIDNTLSQKFNKGIYSCSLTVSDDKVTIPVFTSNDCVLLVK